ncbi:stage V sporulation protein AC [Paenibacillus anaericanus]|uniref:Stage V sporulation protein AC n=1 Tax=Paenibacillus anaericanus TaxID=170367 RepID=A0A433YAD0_9BACL|nr:stage V sporulation protein AC [Paenibacillus anaericanus]MDQ0090518.1 stage V sporulation protein AC [Paenibacillus anaericanus]RUT46824.1 stage V sporulation protein AC [Paenibacillus anaericanus]
MSNKKSKKLTPTQQQYQRLASSREPKRPVAVNCLRAFLSGGFICLLGECIRKAFITYGGFTEKTASDPTVAVLIILSVILTCLGVYDKIAQWAGAGSAVPVTGFANSMASSAIEHRAEGLVLGVGAGMFQLAGSVIVFGTVAAFIIGLIYALFVPGFAGGGH